MKDESRFARYSDPSHIDRVGERLIIVEESIADLAGGVLVRFEGDITPSCTAEIEQLLDRLIEDGRRRMVMDLSAVSFVCSAGWGAFLGRVKDVRRTGGDMIFAGLRPDVLGVFELLEAGRVFQVFGREHEAIRALRSGRSR